MRRSRHAGHDETPDAAASARSNALPENGLGRAGHTRFDIFGFVALVWFAIIAVRLLDLQVLQGRELADKAVRQQEATVDIPARRGAILDRNGQELALSTPAESIGVFADRIEDKAAVATTLAVALDMPEAPVLERLHRGGFQWVKRLVSLAEARRARELGLDVLHFETESKRYYPHGTVGAHVLGTVGLDHHGQAGLEQRFESQLSGESGLGVLYYDARQRRYGRQVLEPTVPGRDLQLDLDLELQSFVHLELGRVIEETKSSAGTVVLMEPDTGQILAMSSWPRFNPNNLSRNATDLENLRNFAVSYMVEPGSTFKVLTAAAALEEGQVTTEDVFDCEMGGMWVGRRRIRDHHPYGNLTMPEVLMKSSNVGIIKIGDRLGSSRLHAYIRRFGFGTSTGLGLPGEVAGLVRPLSRWSGSSRASLSMGQEIGVTAVQMARLFATIANGGKLVSPRIVRSVRSPSGAETLVEQEPPTRVISAETAATMQAILEQVVEGGTGRLAQIQGYRVAGKTGTAQMINPVSRSYADGAYMASFCGFAPVNDPALVGVVMLYDPRGQFYYGGRIAAPLFSSVMRWALRYLDVPPSKRVPRKRRPAQSVSQDLLVDFVEGRVESPEAGETLALGQDPIESESTVPPQPQPDTAPQAVAPDMRGLTMREAFTLAASLGIQIESTGSGVALEQIPAPSEALADGEALRLRFGRGPALVSTGGQRPQQDGG